MQPEIVLPGLCPPGEIPVVEQASIGKQFEVGAFGLDKKYVYYGDYIIFLFLT